MGVFGHEQQAPAQGGSGRVGSGREQVGHGVHQVLLVEQRRPLTRLLNQEEPELSDEADPLIVTSDLCYGPGICCFVFIVYLCVR